MVPGSGKMKFEEDEAGRFQAGAVRRLGTVAAGTQSADRVQRVVVWAGAVDTDMEHMRRSGGIEMHSNQQCIG